MIIDDVIETTLTIVLTRAHSWITHIRAPPRERAVPSDPGSLNRSDISSRVTPISPVLERRERTSRRRRRRKGADGRRRGERWEDEASV